MNEDTTSTGHAQPVEVSPQTLEQARQTYLASLDHLRTSDVQVAVEQGWSKLQRLALRQPRALRQTWDSLVLLVQMIGDYVAGRYRNVLWGTIAAAAGAVLYFVSPLDAIPDMIPVLGYMDDAAVIGLCLKLIARDLESYRQWRHGVNATVIAAHEAGTGPIQIFIHGYRAVRDDAERDRIGDRIRACGLAGSSYLVHWQSGQWAQSTLTTLQVGQTARRWWQRRSLRNAASVSGSIAAGVAVEITDFKQMEQRAEALGRSLHQHLEAIPGIHDRPVHLIGHSLGARVIHHALASADWNGVALHDCVLLAGAANRDDSNWPDCLTRIRGRLYNAYNPADWVLRLAGRHRRVGRYPMKLLRLDGMAKVVNIRCDGLGHVEAWTRLDHVLRRVWRGR